jgi:hypothetical protein
MIVYRQFLFIRIIQSDVRILDHVGGRSFDLTGKGQDCDYIGQDKGLPQNRDPDRGYCAAQWWRRRTHPVSVYIRL